jgi:hypothetical protein
MPLTYYLDMLGDEAPNSPEHARAAIEQDILWLPFADLAILANSTFFFWDLALCGSTGDLSCHVGLSKRLSFLTIARM